jgi:ribonuclease P protein component
MAFAQEWQLPMAEKFLHAAARAAASVSAHCTNKGVFMPAVVNIRKRADFIRAKEANKTVAASGLVMQVAVTEQGISGSEIIRIGFTTSSKLGNAVKRNRIKRRLRACAREVMAGYAMPGNDYVIIGRVRALDRDFQSLVKDLKYALHNTGTYRKNGSVKEFANSA